MSVRGLGPLLRDTFLPRDRFRVAILLLVALRSPVVWLVSSVIHGEPLEVTALYRPGGDIQYFELVASLSRGELGESNLHEAAGAGIHPFPLGSISLHAGCFALMGAAGLLLADVVATVVFAGTLTFLGRVLALPARVAAAFGGLVATSAYVVLWPLTNRLGWGKDLLWGDRFPRPLVSETFFILAMTAAAALAVRLEEPRRRIFWVGAGVALSLCVQSDIYSAFIVGMVMLTVWLRAVLAIPARRRELLVGALITAASVALTAWPFVLQRSGTSAELLQRWGAYPLPRGVALGWIREVPLTGPVLFSVAALAALVWLRRTEAAGQSSAEGAKGKRVVAFWALACALATVAMPLFFGILGQGMYPYMFPDRLRRIALYGAIFVVLVAASHATQADRAAPARRWSRIARGLPAGVLVVMAAMIGLRAMDNVQRTTHTRRNWYDFGALGAYRPAFAELVRELDARRSAEHVVLATLDQQVHVYWQTFGGARTFVPDAFVSIAPDAEVERRFAMFGKLIGMPTETWLELVQADGFNTMFLAVSKYSANSAWATASPEEYTADQRAAIARRGIFDAFSPEVPRMELDRLRRLYEATPVPRGDAPRVDLVVMTNDPRFAPFAPSREDFALLFENAIFRLYERR